MTTDAADLEGYPEFTPGVYQHFKGILAEDGSGLYYAAGVALSSETRADPVVVYYSYAKQAWNYRPLVDTREVPPAQKCGWFDPINRHSYRGPRFVLVRGAPFLPPSPPTLEPPGAW